MVEEEVFESEYSEKSRSTAGNLGVILGPLGAHRFYLGYPIHGIIQIILSVSIIGAMWGIYEGITILWGNRWVDAEGRLLRPSPSINKSSESSDDISDSGG